MPQYLLQMFELGSIKEVLHKPARHCPSLLNPIPNKGDDYDGFDDEVDVADGFLVNISHVLQLLKNFKKNYVKLLDHHSEHYCTNLCVSKKVTLKV